MSDAIVLAAGKSTRYGKSNKLFSEIHNKTLIFHIVNEIINSKVKKVIIVTGRDHKEICTILKGFNVDIIYNQNYETGISSSISTGVNHLPQKSSSAMICLADMPLLATNDYNEMIDFNQQNGGVSRIVAPYRNKTIGNPVIFGKNYFKQLYCLNGDKGGKAILDKNSENLIKFKTKSEGFYFDIDNKNDFLKFKSL